MMDQIDVQKPVQKKKWILPVLILFIVLGLVGIIFFIFLRTTCFSVGDAWKFAHILDRQRICVQGKAHADIPQTEMLCNPPSCDCNQSSGQFTLDSEDVVVRNPRISIVDSVTIYDPICSGNECTMTCTPLNPFAAQYFRFIGRLAISYLSDGRMLGLQLVDVDLPASRQLINGDWQPIPTGEFEVSR